jgi:type IV secretory pathway protease TraF
VFLLSPKVADAYDGRYFGLTRASEIIGTGKLLWPR